MMLNYLVDLSYFFNKYNLRIPTASHMGMIRIFIIGFFFIGMGTDFYKYITIRKGYKMHLSVFIGIAIIIIETLMYFKHVNLDSYDHAIPMRIKIGWFIFLGILAFIWI